MVKRPAGFNAFEFVVMSAQRAAQLQKGCIPLIPAESHKHSTTAQMEVASYLILRSPDVPVVAVALDEPIALEPVVAE